jgi:hypothetical protein
MGLKDNGLDRRWEFPSFRCHPHNFNCTITHPIWGQIIAILKPEWQKLLWVWELYLLPFLRPLQLDVVDKVSDLLGHSAVLGVNFFCP